MLNSKCNFKDKEEWGKKNKKIKMEVEKVKTITYLTSIGARRSVDLDQRRSSLTPRVLMVTLSLLAEMA